ncbi:MAG: SRPBCC domain-containing protein [Aquabacterium sp.]|jgi:uncharacterized protein YndB with AHSA1/START domain|uniref:SRPBCC family protein n=1 Tax=Aquabacterium sp. TaxID=1872578 RepID=UPI003BB21CB3
MKTLTFETTINAPRARVWDTMLKLDTYQAWTAAFCEGSTYEGSWDKGARIRFGTPSGHGTIAIIAENQLHTYVSIQHIGMIDKGVEDTTSDKVKAMTPAFENYRFTDTPQGTLLTVTMDTIPDYEQYMHDTYPKALALLKELCER